jgi:hypothetical protein
MDRVSAPNYFTIGGKRYFRDKNPGAGVPFGTSFAAQFMDGVQESIIGTIEAAGLVPADSALGSPDTQLAQAIRILAARATGQCRLSVASASSLLLSPFNGNGLWVAGAPVSIPAAGVSIANTGLTGSTLYYVYARTNAGALTLELSPTAYTVSSTDGTLIKTGDATRALVGMVFTASSTPGTFVDTAAARFCANWFNRRDRELVGAYIAGAVTGSTSPTELWSGARALFLAWADEAVSLGAYGNAQNNTSGDGASVFVGLDGAAAGATSAMYSASAGQASGTSALHVATIAEGVHTLSPFGASQVGGTSTYNVNAIGSVRI